jgi:hypothetical protein
MSWPSRAFLVVLSALAAVAASRADRAPGPQSAPASERPDSLTVDFVAVEADGTPVADLQASEVEIRIGDRVRALRSIRRVAAAPVPAAPGAPVHVPPPYSTNDDVAAGRRFVLVIDQESFEPGREQLFRNAVDGLMGQLTPADRTMVAALPFGGATLSFTSNTTAIRLVVERVAGQRSRSETGSELACRTRRFLESLEGLLGRPGAGTSPMTLVLFTAGLAAPRRDAPMGLMPGMCELLVEQFRRLATVAGAARANVYVMHPTDVGMSTSMQRPTIGGVGDNGSDNPLEGIEHLAGATGAARLSLDATGTGSLLRVAKETSAYYVAEVEPVRGEVFGRSRPLEVRVARRGVIVRARPVITFPEPRRTRITPPTLSDLLASAEPFTDLRLRAGGFSVRDAEGRLRVGVVVEPTDPGATLSSAGAILIDGDGRVAARWVAKAPSDRPLLGAMAVTPGRYRLRVAAIDVDGRQGAAEGPIEAGLTQVGALSLGSLMLGVSRNGSTALQLEFGPEPTATASFDIYGGTAGLRLSATLEVSRALDGPPIVAVPLVLTRAPDLNNEGRVVATGAVPVGALPPGDYVVRGTIGLEDGTTGRVVRTLRKVAR